MFAPGSVLLLSSKVALVKLTVYVSPHCRPFKMKKRAPAEFAATFARIAEESTETALWSANKPPPYCLALQPAIEELTSSNAAVSMYIPAPYWNAVKSSEGDVGGEGVGRRRARFQLCTR